MDRYQILTANPYLPFKGLQIPFKGNELFDFLVMDELLPLDCNHSPLY